MAEYKAIRGHTIRTIAGDPSPLVIRDIWYSNTTRKIRGAKIGAGAWASGPNLNTATNNTYPAKHGTQTAGLISGGGGLTATLSTTQLYNGTAWSASPEAVPEAAYQGSGAGTQTAALRWGGHTGTSGAGACFEWDGSSWGDGGALPKYHANTDGAGTQTAALSMAGDPPFSPLTMTYNGTAWSIEDNNLNNQRTNGAAFGTQTDAIFVSGWADESPPNPQVYCESWNGTSWTEVADLNTSREGPGSIGVTGDAGQVFGGSSPPYSVRTEAWDGSSWTEVADLATGRNGANGFGPESAGVCIGGGVSGSPSTVATEEWTKAVAASSFTSS